jgi:hypothetical protein
MPARLSLAGNPMSHICAHAPEIAVCGLTNDAIRRHAAGLGLPPTPISDVVVPLLAAASDGW